jgi:hypothetical protein
VSSESFTSVMFQVDIFWVVTPCSVVVGYQCFGGSCCLHLQDEYGGSMVLRNVGILFTHKNTGMTFPVKQFMPVPHATV